MTTATDFIKISCIAVLVMVPSNVWACSTHEKLLNSKSILFVVMLESIFCVIVLIGWAIRKKFYPIVANNWRRIYFYLFGFLAITLSIGLGLFGTFGVPAFEGVFASAGSDLPPLTAFLFAGRNFLWAITITTVLFCLHFRKPKRVTPLVIMCALNIGPHGSHQNHVLSLFDITLSDCAHSRGALRDHLYQVGGIFFCIFNIPKCFGASADWARQNLNQAP